MSRTISVDTTAGPVAGTCDTRFAAVSETFIENFEKRDEVGASVSITIDGRKVVDLWGGRKTPDGDPWLEDTVCTVFSSTKGAMSLCAHLLADRGVLDLDAPVTDYWPEFAADLEPDGDG